MPEIKILLDKKGGIEAEGHHFVGPECEEALNFLNQLFGDAVSNKQKEEYFMINQDARECLGNGFCG